MIFTSWVFLIFLVAVLAAYFFLGRWWRAQNILLLVASYVFYGFWDWRFLGLLVGMTAINYGAGWAISRQPLPRDTYRDAKKNYREIVPLISENSIRLTIFPHLSF
jgi:D-alanyl-lipoteichoic acid acyltransferase DltB (MBOAT superfamily)